MKYVIDFAGWDYIEAENKEDAMKKITEKIQTTGLEIALLTETK